VAAITQSLSAHYFDVARPEAASDLIVVDAVDVLWQASRTAAAIRLEMLWNQLAQTHLFALLCGYSMGHFYKDVGQQEVRQQHTHLVSDSGERVTLH
jgi:hypothetical protein